MSNTVEENPRAVRESLRSAWITTTDILSEMKNFARPATEQTIKISKEILQIVSILGGPIVANAALSHYAYGANPVQSGLGGLLATIGLLIGGITAPEKRNNEGIKVLAESDNKFYARLAIGTIAGSVFGQTLNYGMHWADVRAEQKKQTAVEQAKVAPQKTICEEHQLKSGDYLIRNGQLTICP